MTIIKAHTTPIPVKDWMLNDDDRVVIHLRVKKEIPSGFHSWNNPKIEKGYRTWTCVKKTSGFSLEDNHYVLLEGNRWGTDFHGDYFELAEDIELEEEEEELECSYRHRKGDLVVITEYNGDNKWTGEWLLPGEIVELGGEAWNNDHLGEYEKGAKFAAKCERYPDGSYTDCDNIQYRAATTQEQAIFRRDGFGASIYFQEGDYIVPLKEGHDATGIKSDYVYYQRESSNHLCPSRDLQNSDANELLFISKCSDNWRYATEEERRICKFHSYRPIHINILTDKYIKANSEEEFEVIVKLLFEMGCSYLHGGYRCLSEIDYDEDAPMILIDEDGEIKHREEDHLSDGYSCITLLELQECLRHVCLGVSSDIMHVEFEDRPYREIAIISSSSFEFEEDEDEL